MSKWGMISTLSVNIPAILLMAVGVMYQSYQVAKQDK